MDGFPSLTTLDRLAVEDGIGYIPPVSRQMSSDLREIIHDLSPMMQEDGFTFPYLEEVVVGTAADIDQHNNKSFVELQVMSADTNPMWGCQTKAEPCYIRSVCPTESYRPDQDFCIPRDNFFATQQGYRADEYDSDGMACSGSESPTSSRSSTAGSDDSDEDYVPLEISDDEEEEEDEAPSPTPNWSSCRYNPSGFTPRAPTPSSKRRHGQPILWKFLFELLMDPKYSKHIHWTNRNKGMFKFSSEHKEEIARMWGEKKGNRCVMTYQKMARSLRNYSNQKRHLVKVKRKLQYQFISGTTVTGA